MDDGKGLPKVKSLRSHFAGWRFGQMGFVRISKPAPAMMIKIN